MDQRTLSGGIYRIWWTDGRSSLAAVGVTSGGDRWVAPTNWNTPHVPSTDPPLPGQFSWAQVLRADRIAISDEGSLVEWRDHVERAHALLGTILDAAGT